MKAIYKKIVIAESKDCIEIEGNQYFPPQSVKMEYLEKSDLKTTCPWKGLASYYNLKIEGESKTNAAWYYPDPKEAAKSIKNYVAFYSNVVEIKK